MTRYIFRYSPFWPADDAGIRQFRSRGIAINKGKGTRGTLLNVSPSGNPGQLLGTTGQPISDPLSIIMGDETLGHGLENMIHGDTSQHKAIEIENHLRREQKQPERAQDPQ